ncbi:hypothetical protein [Melittangium boletus]|uniref:Uncharacterized protein n=1 Tax=Melittangium boletus DSM 14713 TaxID=1294270 RepID=A0A250ICN3_9BACT|nr:hypothetical protein [Melittangium boletus]ATB29609.1 hypothetical protein MEBOL_003064 [Melittangium boletus DSM 14713]
MVLFHAIHPTGGSRPSYLLSGSDPTALTENLSVDGRLWPLLVAKFGPDSQATDLEAYLEVRNEWLRRREPHVHVLDVRELSLSQVCSSIRQRYIDWLREHADTLRPCLLGSAYLLRSPEGRIMTSLIRHCAGMNSPYVITPTQSQAITWAAERLQDAGLAPAATRVRAAFSIPAS